MQGGKKKIIGPGLGKDQVQLNPLEIWYAWDLPWREFDCS